MAFSFTQDGKAKLHGACEITFGRWNNGTTDACNIESGGAVVCDLMLLSNTGAAVEATVPAVNEVHPGPTTHTILNGTDDNGLYFALVR